MGHNYMGHSYTSHNYIGATRTRKHIYTQATAELLEGIHEEMRLLVRDAAIWQASSYGPK